jgi:quercetin dioxygenase-like cupin family protein
LKASGDRRERASSGVIISSQCDPLPAGIPGVTLREFVSARCGARDISTGSASFQPGAAMPCHKHSFSEALTILAGEASCSVEGRRYRMRRLDCMHIPAGLAHQTHNISLTEPLIAFWVFASGAPTRELVSGIFATVDRGYGGSQEGDPEHLVRFNETSKYELSSGARFLDLFARRFGAVGIEGGYGELDPGSSLSYRVHDDDESITILTGEMVCELAGEKIRLKSSEGLFVPRGIQHRFFNGSEVLMSMVWARACTES